MIRKTAGILLAVLLLSGCASVDGPTVIEGTTGSTTGTVDWSGWESNLNVDENSTTSTSRTGSNRPSDFYTTSTTTSKTTTTTTTTPTMNVAVLQNVANAVGCTGKFGTIAELSPATMAKLLPLYADLSAYATVTTEGELCFALTETAWNALTEACWGIALPPQGIDTHSQSYRIIWDGELLVYTLQSSGDQAEQYAATEAANTGNGFTVRVYRYIMADECPDGSEGRDWIADGERYRDILEWYTATTDKNGLLIKVE